MAQSSFLADPGFCANCGSILPVLKSSGGVVCYTCNESYDAESLDTTEVHYELHFNAVEPEERKKKKEGKEAAGPVVERRCARCGHDEMSYATLQLRSADEGQTVFYTCTKCQFKETENS